MKYFRSNSLAWDIQRYHAYEEHCDKIQARKEKYLLNEYEELCAERDESVIDCIYDDGEIEFVSADRYIERHIDYLDSDDFDY